MVLVPVTAFFVQRLDRLALDRKDSLTMMTDFYVGSLDAAPIAQVKWVQSSGKRMLGSCRR